MANKMPWFKHMYTDITDRRIASLPDDLWRRYYEFISISSHEGLDGYLPDIADIAWVLRADEDQITSAIEQLISRKLLVVDEIGTYIAAFAGQQAPTTPAQRMRLHRDRRNNQSDADNNECYDGVTTMLQNVTQKKKKIKEVEEEVDIDAKCNACYDIDTPTIDEPSTSSTASQPIQRRRPFATVDSVPAGHDGYYVRVWSAVTGQPAIPGNAGDVMEKLDALLDSVGGNEQALIDRLKPCWDAWTRGKRKDGRSFSRTNTGWVDWAIDGRVPDMPRRAPGINFL